MNESKKEFENNIENLKEEIINIIKTKYKNKYIPEIESIIDAKVNRIQNYFEYDNPLNISNIDTYLQAARIDIKNYAQRIIERREEEIKEDTGKIVDNSYDTIEDLEFGTKKAKNQIAINTIDKQNYSSRIEILIESKILEVEANIKEDLYRKGNSEITVNNFSLIVENNKTRIIDDFINDITGTVRFLDRELIAEIDEKCDELLSKSVKENEDKEENREENARETFLSNLQKIDTDRIRENQVKLGQQAQQTEQTQEKPKEYDLSIDDIF